jgi:beta-glucosidase-like glycosyl hydrolase
MKEKEDILTPDVRFHLIKKMERHKVIAVAGTELLPHEAKYMEFHRVAGVILFERNVKSLSQVNDLVGSISEQLTVDEMPPLVMADHEGDFVAELKQIIGIPPSAMAIAAAGDFQLARDVARETGLVMKKLGLNVVLAPVADCCFDLTSPITGLRTFGSDPERVAEFVECTIDGFHDAGILTCAKHFPGHGSTPEDSHETLPEVTKSLEDLQRDDLIPFRRAIDAGVDLMMVSHVAFPMGGDSLTPASFDGKIMRDLLRDEMGYRGVVITDSLDMAGARWFASGRRGEFSGGFERSLLAGSDLLLHTKPIPETVHVEGSSEPVMSWNVMQTIIRTLEKVVDQSRIDQKLEAAAQENEALRNVLNILEESDERVAELRAKLTGRLEPVAPPAKKSKVIQFNAYPSVPTVYRNVAEESIAAWGGVAEFEAPLPDQHYVIMPVEWAVDGSLHKQDLDCFVDVVCKHFPSSDRTDLVKEFVLGDNGEVCPDIPGGPAVIDATRYTGKEMISLFEVPAEAELVIVFSSRGMPSEDFLASLQAFAERNEPAAVLLTGWPVTGWIPESTPVLLCFGASSQVASAAAEILAGNTQPAGKTAGLFPKKA